MARKDIGGSSPDDPRETLHHRFAKGLLDYPYHMTPYSWVGSLRDSWKGTPETSRVAAQYRADLRSAERFVIDDGAVRHAVAASVVAAERTVDRTILARLPFEHVWMEWNLKAQTDEQARVGTSAYNEEGEVPEQSGYLLSRVDPQDPTRWRATKVSSTEWMTDLGKYQPKALLNPNMYIVDTEGGLVPPDGEFPSGQWDDVSLLGWGYNDRPDEDWPRIRERLLSRSVTEMEPLSRIARDAARAKGKKEVILRTGQDLFSYSVTESRGDVRLLVTLLAMIAEVPVSFVHHEPRGSYLGGGRMREFMAHRTVSLVIPRRARSYSLEKLLAQAVAKKRRHRVMGHWRRVFDRRTREVKGRTWVEAHERGDASLGWINHDYEVTT